MPHQHRGRPAREARRRARIVLWLAGVIALLGLAGGALAFPHLTSSLSDYDAPGSAVVLAQHAIQHATGANPEEGYEVVRTPAPITEGLVNAWRKATSQAASSRQRHGSAPCSGGRCYRRRLALAALTQRSRLAHRRRCSAAPADRLPGGDRAAWACPGTATAVYGDSKGQSAARPGGNETIGVACRMPSRGGRCRAADLRESRWR